jgi:hypothetical protein
MSSGLDKWISGGNNPGELQDEPRHVDARGWLLDSIECRECHAEAQHGQSRAIVAGRDVLIDYWECWKCGWTVAAPEVEL